MEGTEVFNFMEKISSTLSYWTKREKVVKKKEVMARSKYKGNLEIAKDLQLGV